MHKDSITGIECLGFLKNVFKIICRKKKKLKEKVCQSGKSQSEFILDMLNL